MWDAITATRCRDHLCKHTIRHPGHKCPRRTDRLRLCLFLICHRFPEVHLNIKFIFYSSSLCGPLVHFASTTNGTLGTLESIERHISVVATTLDCGHICYWPLRTPVQHSCCLSPVFPLLTHRLVASLPPIRRAIPPERP